MIEVFGSVPDSDHAQLQYKKFQVKNDVLIKTKSYLICEIYNFFFFFDQTRYTIYLHYLHLILVM